MNKERIKELALKITNIREDEDVRLDSLYEVIKYGISKWLIQ